MGSLKDLRRLDKSFPVWISKEGDPYLRTLLVQGAHHILGPFGADSDLRRWGLKLAERGGKNGKKRAVIATARKLAVLLHRLWVSGEAYEPGACGTHLVSERGHGHAFDTFGVCLQFGKLGKRGNRVLSRGLRE